MLKLELVINQGLVSEIVRYSAEHKVYSSALFILTIMDYSTNETNEIFWRAERQHVYYLVLQVLEIQQ